MSYELDQNSFEFTRLEIVLNHHYLEEGLLDGDHVPGAELLHAHAVKHRGNGRRLGVVKSEKTSKKVENKVSLKS